MPSSRKPRPDFPSPRSDTLAVRGLYEAPAPGLRPRSGSTCRSIQVEESEDHLEHDSQQRVFAPVHSPTPQAPWKTSAVRRETFEELARERSITPPANPRPRYYANRDSIGSAVSRVPHTPRTPGTPGTFRAPRIPRTPRSSMRASLTPSNAMVSYESFPRFESYAHSRPTSMTSVMSSLGFGDNDVRASRMRFTETVSPLAPGDTPKVSAAADVIKGLKVVENALTFRKERKKDSTGAEIAI